MTKSLRDHRHDAGLAMTRLAALSGLTYGTISNIERGRVRPSLHTIKSVSAALVVKPGDVAEFAPALGALEEVFYPTPPAKGS